ncbi:MAG TPA: hypothetical protein VFV97_09045 [Rhodanobacteraceae bacterium]|nr:hypothetical protein [Rhodanobacteraceae bacterium]
MSRRLLQPFILVCLAFASGAASAVALNPRGVGQVLIYPYYTVNAGQDTLLTLVNTADTAKLVRVRFLEGYNGRTAFATYVFLSAHDVWTAAISEVADDGGAKIATADASCTYPPLAGGTEAFSDFDFAGALADTGPTSITRTREGSIEVVEAGDIVPGSATETAITHAQNGLPGGGVPPCTFATGAGTQPIDLADLTPPTGGLYGSGAIVNVLQGTFFAYDATALDGFTDDVPVDDLRDYLEPSLDQAHSGESPATARAYVPVDGVGNVALDFDNGIDAVSAVLMAPSLYNEFLIDPGLGANTDWVVTFPTKRFYVDEDRYPHASGLPFVEPFGSTVAGQSRLTFALTAWDREELSPEASGCGFICPGQSPNNLPYEVNVYGFLNAGPGTPSGVLGSVLTFFYGDPPTLSALGNEGWAYMDLFSSDGGHFLPGGTLSTGEGAIVHGLPVVGFMVYNVVNANAQPGVLGNYGGAFAHRSALGCFDMDGLVCPTVNP